MVGDESRGPIRIAHRLAEGQRPVVFQQKSVLNGQ